MAEDPQSSRERAEAKLNKAQRITDDARAQTDADLQSARRKTDRLRKLRLAKEAKEGVTEPDRKPAANMREGGP